MNANPPAIVEQAPETDQEFRRWVREEFKHQRELHKAHGETLQLILEAMKKDEGDDGR